MKKNIKSLVSVSILTGLISLPLVMFSSSVSISSKDKIEISTNYSDNGKLSKLGWKTPEIRWTIEEIEFGNQFSAMVLSDPEGNDYLYTWGLNTYGNLGLGSDFVGEYISTPTLVTFDGIQNYQIKEISLGYDYMGAILTDEYGIDNLYTWGNNSHNVLGIEGEPEYASEPSYVNMPTSYEHIKYLTFGVNTSGFVLENEKGYDTIYAWGDNSMGQLGLGDTESQKFPTEVSLGREEVSVKSYVAGDSYTTIAVTFQEDFNDNPPYKDPIWTFSAGDGGRGQLGIGEKDWWGSYDMAEVIYPDKYFVTNLKEMSANKQHTISLVTLTDKKNEKDSKDYIYTWGTSNWRQPGYPIPTLVELEIPNDASLKSVAAGPTNFAAIVTNDEGHDSLYAWGNQIENSLGVEDNDSGTYIDGTSKDKPLLVVIDSNYYDYEIKDVTLGTDHSGMVLVNPNGTESLYTWGSDSHGQLGENKNYNPEYSEEDWVRYPKLVNETFFISFDNQQPQITNDKITGQKTLSFTLDWDDNNITPTKAEIIDSKGKTIFEFNEFDVQNGINKEYNITKYNPVDNLRLKISDNEKTLIISEPFYLTETLIPYYPNVPVSTYEWMNGTKKLSFTLSYLENETINSIYIKDSANDDILDITIDPSMIMSNQQNTIDITNFKNSTEIFAYISVETNTGTYDSSNFIIPPTQLNGILTIFIIILLVLIPIVLIVVITIIATKLIKKYSE